MIYWTKYSMNDLYVFKMIILLIIGRTKSAEKIRFVTGFYWNAAVNVKFWSIHIVSGSLLLIRYKTVFAVILLFEKKTTWCQNPAFERTFLLLKRRIVSDERNHSSSSGIFKTILSFVFVFLNRLLSSSTSWFFLINRARYTT